MDYFLARYYSSAQGRFTSPDEFTGGPDELFDFAEVASDNPTFYADLHEPQSLNKYQYAYNNPFRYIDPNGHGVKDWLKKAGETARQTVLGATSAFLQDNGINVDDAGNSAGRFIGHGAAIVQGVVEVVTGANAAVAGTGEAIVTSPAAGTGVGALVPAAGAAVAVVGAAVAAHGTSVLLRTGRNVTNPSNQKKATGPKAEDAPGVSAGGQATDRHGNKLGPSGEPMVNTTRSTTRDAARSRALNEGSRAVEHRSPKRGNRHFHPADAKGRKKPTSTHHEY